MSGNAEHREMIDSAVKVMNASMPNPEQLKAGLIAEVRELQGRLDRVRELHEPQQPDNGEPAWCAECTGTYDTSETPWPCATVRLANGEVL